MSDELTTEEIAQELDRLDTIATRAMNRAYKTEDEIEELSQRVTELEDLVGTLQKRVPKRSTDEKLADLVEYAMKRRNGQPIVQLTPEEIQGIWGCSERYAYKLCNADEGLPAKKDWILTRQTMKKAQFGSAEIDNYTKRIGIDFDGVQSIGCPLNRFNNEQSEKEVSA